MTSCVYDIGNLLIAELFESLYNTKRLNAVVAQTSICTVLVCYTLVRVNLNPSKGTQRDSEIQFEKHCINVAIFMSCGL